MARVTISLPARNDLGEIWVHIAKDNSAAADRMLDRIRDLCELHAAHPGTGTSGDQFHPGLRYFSVGSYVIFFRGDAEGLLVVRVLHGARDLDEIFHG
jgi:toxin ParE1/3/4